jgi:cation transport ATPase
MITGDTALIAEQVAHKVGITTPVVLTGEALQRIGDDALPVRADSANVFAEIEPGQKERIVRALQRRGHVVGYMGDGINDAPALHTADVSISVQQAADGAKAAADIVLLEGLRHRDGTRSAIHANRRWAWVQRGPAILRRCHGHDCGPVRHRRRGRERCFYHLPVFRR